MNCSVSKNELREYYIVYFFRLLAKYMTLTFVYKISHAN